MANPYIPRRDALALAWMKSFVGGIAKTPSAFMFSPGEAKALNEAVERFETALRIATTEPTRTKGTVNEKDQLRNAAEQFCMVYAQQIKLSHGISDQEKIDIGVRPINRNRSPIHVPLSSPLLNIIGATPHSHTLRYRDSNTPTSPGKPFGAMALQLFVAVADEPVRDPEQAKWYGQFTRNPIGVAFEHKDDMMKATYFARWISRRGEVGPWSAPVSMSIAA